MAEDYLTVVWKAYEWPGGRPTTTDIADQLGVTPSTVSSNLRRLARDGLVDYEAYGTATLTADGERIAVDLVRRHRVIETYLVERLGLTWDEVHPEADLLEHAVSDRVLARMDAALGHPAADPHGDRIPREGDTLSADTYPADGAITLAAGGDATDVVVVRVSDRSPEILRYLADKGIGPGTALHVVTAAGPTGTIAVRRGEESLELSTSAAAAVWVRPAAPAR